MRSTSPSVYIVYEDLLATNFCGHPGSIMHKATVALQQWQVSSIGPDEGQTAVNFADLSNCFTKTAGSNTNAYDFIYDSCFPTLQYDISYLKTFQPAWATCVPVGGWVWDPPSALTSVSSLNGVDPHIPIAEIASPSLTISTSPGAPDLIKPASPGAHLPPAPPLTDPPNHPSRPRQTSVDPPGQASHSDRSNDAPTDPTIRSPADPSEPTEPSTKSENAAAAGQAANNPVSDPQNAVRESTTSTSQDLADIIPNKSKGPTASSSDASPANNPVSKSHNAATESTASTSQDPAVLVSNKPDTLSTNSPDTSHASGPRKDPIGGPSDPGVLSPTQPLVASDETNSVLKSDVTALKVGSRTLNAHTPVLTISNPPISLESDKFQIGTSAHPLMDPAPTLAGNRFTIDPESFTLSSQGITTDGTRIKISGPAVTSDKTPVSLGSSGSPIAGTTDSSTPASGDFLVDVSGKGTRIETRIEAGTEVKPETAAGISGALPSGRGATGGDAATPSNGSGRSGNGNVAAPFLGTASKLCGRVDLWVRIGSGVLMVGYLVM